MQTIRLCELQLQKLTYKLKCHTLTSVWFYNSENDDRLSNPHPQPRILSHHQCIIVDNYRLTDKCIGDSTSYRKPINHCHLRRISNLSFTPLHYITVDAQLHARITGVAQWRSLVSWVAV